MAIPVERIRKFQSCCMRQMQQTVLKQNRLCTHTHTKIKYLPGNFGQAETHRTHHLIMGNLWSEKSLDGYQHYLRYSQIMRKQHYPSVYCLGRFQLANLTVLEEYISLFVFISGQMHLLATITAIPQSPYIKKKKQGKKCLSKSE